MIKNAPGKIWLVLGDDDPESFDDDDFNDLSAYGEVSWSAQQEYDADICYIRKDIHDSTVSALMKELKAVKENYRWITAKSKTINAGAR